MFKQTPKERSNRAANQINKNKALHDEKIQKPVPTKMVSSDMEEKMAASYVDSHVDSHVDNKTEICCVSQDNDLNQLKSRNESEDTQQIDQVVDKLVAQNENLNIMSKLNQTMDFVANSVMNQNTNQKQSKDSYSYYSEESANKRIQQRYSSSLRYDNTSSENQPSENNDASQQNRSNINGFFHHEAPTKQNRKSQVLMGSSDSYISVPVVTSKRRNPEKPPKASVGMTSNTPVDLNTQLPSDKPTEQQEENHRRGKGCCSIM